MSKETSSQNSGGQSSRIWRTAGLIAVYGGAAFLQQLTQDEAFRNYADPVVLSLLGATVQFLIATKALLDLSSGRRRDDDQFVVREKNMSENANFHIEANSVEVEGLPVEELPKD